MVATIKPITGATGSRKVFKDKDEKMMSMFFENNVLVKTLGRSWLFTNERQFPCLVLHF